MEKQKQTTMAKTGDENPVNRTSTKYTVQIRELGSGNEIKQVTGLSYDDAKTTAMAYVREGYAISMWGYN